MDLAEAKKALRLAEGDVEDAYRGRKTKEFNLRVEENIERIKEHLESEDRSSRLFAKLMLARLHVAILEGEL